MKTISFSFLFTPMNMTKNNYGSASTEGVIAAVLAQKGFVGPVDVLDGNDGFWAMAGYSQCDFDKITEELGEKNIMLNTYHIKRYPSCAWTHASINTATDVVLENKLEMEDIEKIVVKTHWHPTRPPFDNPTPKNYLQAQFSTKYTIAIAIAGVKAGLQWHAEKNRTNPKILELAKKVDLINDPDADKAFNEGEGILVTVYVKAKGSWYTKALAAGYPYLEPNVNDKFRDLASAVGMKPKNIDRIIETIEKLEEVEDMSNLMKLFHEYKHT